MSGSDRNKGNRATLRDIDAPLNVAVVGASGGLGRAICEGLSDHLNVGRLFCLSRSGQSVAGGEGVAIDFAEPDSLDRAADSLRAAVARIDLLFNCVGLLHGDGVGPEKSLQQLRPDAMEQLFRVNCFGPILLARALEPLIQPSPVAVFANLSARVGSITDNGMGGWYSYRASKAALNMMMKTLAIEWQRRRAGSVVAMFQPGTVETPLSQPFLGGQPADRIKRPEDAADHLLKIVAGLTPEQTGAFLDWRGEMIPF